MSRREPDSLTPELARLLAQERNFPPQPAERRMRVTARARESLRAPAPRSAWSFSGRRALLLVAAVLVSALAAAAVTRWLEPRAVLAPNAARSLQARSPRAALVSKASPERASDPAPPSMRTAPEPAATAKTVALSRHAQPGDTYALELAVLKRARAAVASQSFADALEAVSEHQRRFPDGKLREEREALRVKALAGLGKNEEARSAAERFRERFPNSVLAPRLEATVRPPP